MRWPEVWRGGKGRVLELLDSWGKGICGAYRAHFLSPGLKTWYLNYALYGLFDASLTSLAAACTLVIFRGRRDDDIQLTADKHGFHCNVGHGNFRGSTTKGSGLPHQKYSYCASECK